MIENASEGNVVMKIAVRMASVWAAQGFWRRVYCAGWEGGSRAVVCLFGCELVAGSWSDCYETFGGGQG